MLYLCNNQIQPCSLNRKHEMFLNIVLFNIIVFPIYLNRKHEMFLNKNLAKHLY